MTSTNVTKFAAELKMPAEVLLEQLRSAGVIKRTPNDEITEADKEQLLSSLRRIHGSDESAKKKITLTRKQTSEIKQADATGKARTIQVEVRKKRVFVKREAGDGLPDTAADAAAVEAEAQAAARAAAEEQARREEEERRQQELLERQAAELREKQQRLEVERQREMEAAAQAARAEQEAQRERDKEAAMHADAEAEAAERQRAESKAAEEAARKAADAAAASAQARRNVENEVAEINRLMALARRPQPKAPPPAPAAPAAAPAAAAAAGAQARPGGTLHRPTAQPGAKPATSTSTDSKDKKHVKAEKLSSSWHEEGAKRRAIKTRGDSSGGGGGWRGPKA